MATSLIRAGYTVVRADNDADSASATTDGAITNVLPYTDLKARHAADMEIADSSEVGMPGSTQLTTPQQRWINPGTVCQTTIIMRNPVIDLFSLGLQGTGRG